MIEYLQLTQEDIYELLTEKDPSLVLSPSQITITPCSLSTPNTLANQTLGIGNVFPSYVGEPNSKIFYLGDLSVLNLNYNSSTSKTHFWYNTESFLCFTKMNQTNAGYGQWASTFKGVLFTGITSSGMNKNVAGASASTSTQQVSLYNFLGIKIQINN